MRKVVAIAVVIAAVAWAAGVDSAWAQGKATSMTVARPDWAQFQAAAIDWLRATVLSWPFAIGLAAGVVLAEGGRFIWRWALKTFGVLNASMRFVLEHRLVAVALAVVVYYVVAQRLIA